MERFSEVVGLPVICFDTGRSAGNVCDIIFSPKERKIIAFLLEQKGYGLFKRVVLLKDIVSIGRDIVVIENASAVKTLKSVEKTGELEGKGEIRGLRIISRAGSDLGVVKDVLFDHRTGLLEGVEISDSFIQDIIRGRNIVPFFGKVEFGEENIIVSREAIEEMQNTGGGIMRKLLGEK